MDVSYLAGFLLSSLEVLAAALVLALGVGAVTVVVVYVIDRNQTEHAVRRNYPVIGRYRATQCSKKSYQRTRQLQMAY